MHPQEIPGLVRRQYKVIAVILVMSLVLGYHLKHINPGYADSATISFFAPKSQSSLFAFGQDLLVMDEVAVAQMSSTAGQDQVARAGGTVPYQVDLVNLNSEDFPNYSDPYLTVWVNSSSPQASDRTYAAVMTVLRHTVTALQARQGSAPDDMIRLRAITSTQSGAIPQQGSSKRMLGGVLVLMIILSLLAAAIVDRRPGLLRWRRLRLGQPLAARRRS